MSRAQRIPRPTAHSRSGLEAPLHLPAAFLLPAVVVLGLTACAGSGDPKTTDTASADDTTGTPTLAACDPTAPTLCGSPFPSTFYMAEDPTTATGWRIDMRAETLPVNIDGFQPQPTYWNEKDGWGVSTPMLAHLPNVALDNLPGHDRIADSLDPSSDLAVIDVDTGERIAVWAERDLSLEDSDRSLLLIHTAAPLDFGHRYVVGIRNVHDTSGAAIPPSEAMAALIDGSETGDEATDQQLTLRRDVYEDVVFPALEAQGWSRDELVLAWDFVTASKAGITGRAVTIRDQTLAWIPEGGPTYTITEVDVAPNESTAYRVKGEVTVPLFTLEDLPGTYLTRDADGMPFIGGETTAKFTAIVPNSVVEGREPAPIVQYGHGLLGGQDEVHAGYLADMADRYGWIIFAMDWTGMKSQDTGAISLMLVQDLGQFATLPERSHQGFAEFHVGLQLFKTAMTTDENFVVTDPDSGETFPLIDPDRTYYYGNSQGGILGGAYAAISSDIDRAVLGVGGGPYHLLLTRSKDFDPFFTIFETMYPDPADVGLWLGLIQTLWDEAEGAGYAGALTRDPLPGTNAKTVLQQVAIGDNQVTTLGAEFLARGHGAVMLDGAVREAWGIETVTGPTTESVIVEYEYGIEEPYTNTPPSDPDPHEWPRRELSGQDQIAHFFETGEIKDFCDGPCGDPDRGRE